MKQVLCKIIEPGKLHHLYIEDQGRIINLIRRGGLGRIVDVTVCGKKVETVKGKERQKEIVTMYHIGKTNHLGANETLAKLKRCYYWIKIQ